MVMDKKNKKMRVGMLTFHTAKNIGAQLQALALFYTLKKMGANVSVVRYEPHYLAAPYAFFRNVKLKNGILSCCKQIILHLINDLVTWNRTMKHYKDFQLKYFKFTKSKYFTPLDLKSAPFDVLIVGSDQIWNPEITNHQIDSMYTLAFDSKKIRKISYAASFSEKHMTYKDAEILAKRLESFDAISLRESSLKDYLSNFLDKNIDVVLDPTLLLSKKEWVSFIPHIPIVKKRYVLLYQARGAKNDVLLQAKELARLYDATVYDASGMNYRVKENGLQYVNPIEFLNLVFYAEAIVTVSFHGTALSIILEKPFYTIALNDGRDGRVLDLLSKVGLEEQLRYKVDKLEKINIDYSKVQDKLVKLRQSSMQFLNDSLK